MARRRSTVLDRFKSSTSPETASAVDCLHNPTDLPFERPWDKEIVAAYLGVTTSGLDKLVKQGKAPPGFKVGRMLRWRPSVVKAWAVAQEERAATEAAKVTNAASPRTPEASGRQTS